MKKAVCVVSGGMDSVTNAIMLLKEGYEVTFFHVNYGQKCELGELLACQAIVEGLRARNYPVDLVLKDISLPWVKDNALINPEREIPDGFQDLYRSTLPDLFVPSRNVIFLAYAASLAEAIGADVITLGCNQSEGLSEGGEYGYGDNTLEFLNLFTRVLELGCFHHKPIVTSPEWELDKVGIVKWIFDNGFGEILRHAWSCDSSPYYNRLPTTSREDLLMCGRCGCDRNRRLAFHILEKMYPGQYPDEQEYADAFWFSDRFLPRLREEGIPIGIWFSKYAKLLGCEIHD